MSLGMAWLWSLQSCIDSVSRQLNLRDFLLSTGAKELSTSTVAWHIQQILLSNSHYIIAYLLNHTWGCILAVLFSLSPILHKSWSQRNTPITLCSEIHFCDNHPCQILGQRTLGREWGTIGGQLLESLPAPCLSVLQNLLRYLYDGCFTFPE